MDLSNFQLYPYPAKGEFMLTFQFQKTSSVKIEMTDALGLTILIAEVQRASGINQQTIRLVRNKYSSGIYLVRIITEGKIMVEKLVVE